MNPCWKQKHNPCWETEKQTTHLAQTQPQKGIYLALGKDKRTWGHSFCTRWEEKQMIRDKGEMFGYDFKGVWSW